MKSKNFIKKAINFYLNLVNMIMLYKDCHFLLNVLF